MASVSSEKYNTGYVFKTQKHIEKSCEAVPLSSYFWVLLLCSHRLVGFRFVCLCPSMQFQMTSLWMHMPDTPPSCLFSTCQPPNFMYLNSSFSSFVLSFSLFLNSTKAVMGYIYSSLATADLDGLVWNEGSNLVPSQLPQLLRQHFCCPRGQSGHIQYMQLCCSSRTVIRKDINTVYVL